jgi:hypothetical protein
MAHLAVCRPFGEFHLGYQRRFDPCGYGFVLHLSWEGRLCRLQPDELSVQLFKRFVAEARADMADISPAVLLAYRKCQRSEKRPRPPRGGKSRDDYFLAFRGLDL